MWRWLQAGLLTHMGTAAPPQRYPWQAHARGLISHLVFGVVTEAILSALDPAQGSDGPERNQQAGQDRYAPRYARSARSARELPENPDEKLDSKLHPGREGTFPKARLRPSESLSHYGY